MQDAKVLGSKNSRRKIARRKIARSKMQDAVLKEEDAVLKEEDAVLKEEDAVLKEEDADKFIYKFVVWLDLKYNIHSKDNIPYIKNKNNHFYGGLTDVILTEKIEIYNKINNIGKLFYTNVYRFLYKRIRQHIIFPIFKYNKRVVICFNDGYYFNENNTIHPDYLNLFSVKTSDGVFTPAIFDLTNSDNLYREDYKYTIKGVFSHHTHNDDNDDQASDVFFPNIVGRYRFFTSDKGYLDECMVLINILTFIPHDIIKIIELYLKK